MSSGGPEQVNDGDEDEKIARPGSRQSELEENGKRNEAIQNQPRHGKL